MKLKSDDTFNEPLLPPPTAPIEEFSNLLNGYEEVDEPVIQHILRAEEVILVNEATPTMPIPMGRWRDNLCSCCAHGCCHPNVVCSLCFPLVALGQIMTRLKMSMTGSRVSDVHSKFIFSLLLLITIGSYFVSDSLFDKPMDSFNVSTILLTLYGFFTIYLIVMIRRSIRNKFQIPHQCCGGLEDCCVAVWCPCLGISQMMRHTSDYSTYRGVWFSTTGIPHGAPPVVV